MRCATLTMTKLCTMYTDTFSSVKKFVWIIFICLISYLCLLVFYIFGITYNNIIKMSQLRRQESEKNNTNNDFNWIWRLSKSLTNFWWWLDCFCTNSFLLRISIFFCFLRNEIKMVMTTKHCFDWMQKKVDT